MTPEGSAALPDSARGNLVDRFAPHAARPYLRLARIDRPIGWELLLAPCWWAAALAGIAAHAAPNAIHLALFLVGAVAMRGAGSTFNDIVDRDLDREVARTRGRPIASGRVSRRAAAAFLVAQALVGFLVLLTFNPFTIALGVASLGIVAVYPFMKRVTSWPQAVLGLAFAWGALVGWAAVFGALGPAPLLLYAGAIAWTMGYDTIYALQDVADDAIVGIGSTARLFGARVRLATGLMFCVAVACVEAAVLAAGGGLLAQVGVAAFAAHLAWQVSRVDAADPTGALRLFHSNRDAGLLLFAGLAASALVQAA